MSATTLDALLALQPLASLPRTGWIQRGVAAPESVGDHVLGACFIVLALGPRVEPPLDVERALTIALVHDAPEALLGDLPRTASELLPPGAKAHAEERAATCILAPLSELAHARFVEYRDRATREARFARVCDRLHLGVRMVGYLRSGVRGLDEFASTVSALDCSEFAPAVALQREILAALSRAA
jgi:putative hydrolase of HD superfamily